MVPTPGSCLERVATAVADPLRTIVAHLAKGPTDYSGEAVLLADLVEADFPGYAPIEVRPDLVNAVEGDTYGFMSPVVLHFEAGNIVTPQAITHIYYTMSVDGVNGGLLSVVPFDNPQVLRAPGDSLEFECNIGGHDFPD